jgi:hypothetical protein
MQCFTSFNFKYLEWFTSRVETAESNLRNLKSKSTYRDVQQMNSLVSVKFYYIYLAIYINSGPVFNHKYHLDCNVTFTRMSYDDHKSCVSENQRYGGKDYVEKGNKVS